MREVQALQPLDLREWVLTNDTRMNQDELSMTDLVPSTHQSLSVLQKCMVYNGMI